MSLEHNKQIACRWLTLVSEHNIEALCAMTAPTWTMHGGPPALPSGPAGIHELFRQIGPVEQTWTIEDVIAEGDKVVVRATNTCVQASFFGIPGAGRRQVFSAMFLLHIVDACAELSGGDVVSTYRAVEGELGEYSDALADRPRWLVLNKLDLLPPEQRKKRVAAIVKKLKWKGPVYAISALTAEGTKRLVQDVMSYLEGQREPAETAKPSRHGA